MNPQEYTIKTLQDIIDKIPPDKIEEFLIDFSNYIRYAKTISQVKIPGVSIETSNTMVWVDDGKHEANIVIKHK